MAMVYSSYWQLEWCQWSSVVDGNVHPAVSHMSPDSPPLVELHLCQFKTSALHHYSDNLSSLWLHCAYPYLFSYCHYETGWTSFSHPYPYISHICRSWQTSENHKPPIFSNLIICERENFERLGMNKKSVLGFVTTGGVYPKLCKIIWSKNLFS